MGYYISKPEPVVGVCVYEHVKGTTGEVFYVGQGKGDRPWSCANRNSFWHSTKNKHGVAVRVVAQGMTRSQADAMEMELIAKYGRRVDKSGLLVNITIGGGGTEGFHHTEETKKKLRDARKGIPQTPEFVAKRTAHRKGMPMSSQAKAALQTYWASPENRAKHSQACMGREVTAEARKKISLAHKGRKLPEHRVEVMRLAATGEGNPMYGKTHTAEAREKIAAARRGRALTAEHKKKIDPTGRKHSEETKAKIGAAHKGRVIPEAQVAKMSRTRRDKLGTPIICVETGRVFPSVSDALDWLRTEQGKLKAQNNGLVKAMERNGSAYGYHWTRPT